MGRSQVQIFRRTPAAGHTFQIQVEVRQEFYSDEMNKMIALKKKIANRMQSVIGLQPDIKIVEPRSIERSMGKAKHVIDNRKLE